MGNYNNSYKLIIGNNMFNKNSKKITTSLIATTTIMTLFVFLAAPAYATETPVTWQNVVGVSVNGDTLTKTSNSYGWNAGASSVESLESGNGYVTFEATETNTYRIVGLSNVDSDQEYAQIDYAIYPATRGSVYVFESGNSRGVFGTYQTGDILKIAVESGVVKYYKNDELLYTSTVAPTYPLLVDTSFFTHAATITNVKVNFSDTIPPTLTIPNDITVNATGQYTIVNIGNATATDDTDPNVTITNNAADSFPVGTTIVTWTATDNSGNSSNATQSVTIMNALYCGLPESSYNVISGTNGSDYLRGTTQDDLILGYGGNDFIRGLTGNDCIYAGDGNDFVQAGAGDDTVYAGNDGDVIITGKGNDIAYGESGDDTLYAVNTYGSNALDGGDGYDICVPVNKNTSVNNTDCEITS